MIPYFIRFVLELLWWDRQHVGLFETKVEETGWEKEQLNVCIHCYESQWGTRYTKVIVRRPSHPDLGNFFMRRRVRRAKLYQTEILPWLHGRAHGKIPSYQKVKGGKWDFLKKLKGETAIVLNDDEK